MEDFLIFVGLGVAFVGYGVMQWLRAKAAEINRRYELGVFKDR